MEELDLLKKHWKKEINFPKISKDEIQKIIHKSSSSIVKWILIISIIELSLGLLLFFIVRTDDKATIDLIETNKFLGIIENTSHLLYFVVLYFIYRFYSIYRKISTQDNTSQLISNILKARKIVKSYMIYNVSVFFILSITYCWIALENEIYNKSVVQHHVSSFEFIVTFTIVFIIICITTGLFWLTYRLIYGYFLRKLAKNYNDLKSIDL